MASSSLSREIPKKKAVSQLTPISARFVFALSFVWLAVPRVAFANRVLSVTSNEEQITLTNEAGKRRWQLNENVCLMKGGEELACGFVGRLTETSLVIKVESRNTKVQAGIDVFLQREDRLPTSREETASATSASTAAFTARRSLDVTLGPVVGINYFYPVVPAFQMAMGRGVSVGLDFRFTQFTRSGVSASAIGGMVNVSYYYNRNTFRGLFFTAGFGLYSLSLKNATVSESQLPVAGQGLIGWRLKPRWAYGIDFGVAGGLQYVTKKSGGLPNDFGGFTPVASLYLGYTF